MRRRVVAGWALLALTALGACTTRVAESSDTLVGTERAVAPPVGPPLTVVRLSRAAPGRVLAVVARECEVTVTDRWERVTVEEHEPSLWVIAVGVVIMAFGGAQAEERTSAETAGALTVGAAMVIMPFVLAGTRERADPLPPSVRPGGLALCGERPLVGVAVQAGVGPDASTRITDREGRASFPLGVSPRALLVDGRAPHRVEWYEGTAP